MDRKAMGLPLAAEEEMCLGRICPALATHGGWTEAWETLSPKLSLQTAKANQPPLEGDLEHIKEVLALNHIVASQVESRKLP